MQDGRYSQKKFLEMPKEVLSIHIGGCGTRVGAEMWSILASEESSKPMGPCSSDSAVFHTSSSPFFYDDLNGRRRPRAVLVDSDPWLSRLGSFVDPEDVLRSTQDCWCNYFEGRRSALQDGFASTVMDRVCTQVERCDNLRSFFVHNSFGGGTGSGVTVEVMNMLRDHFPKQAIFQPLVYPSTDSSTATVEPYNCIFGLSGTRDLASLVIMLDNQAAFRICRGKQRIRDPSFSDMNKVIARVVCGCTASLRAPSTVNATPDEIIMNLVPQPVFHYAIPSVAPIVPSAQVICRETVHSLFDPTLSLCDSANMKINRYFAATVVARGKGLGSHEVQKHVYELKSTSKSAKFVSWVPNSFKVGVVDSPNLSAELVLLANTTAIRGLFVRQYKKFLELMFHKAYVWQFLEAGGEMDEFMTAKENVKSIIDEYAEVLSQAKSEESVILQKQLTQQTH